MSNADTSFLFVGLVLPCLFALTLIAEGAWKLSQKMSGWISLLLGIAIMIATIWMYFGLSQIIVSS